MIHTRLPKSILANCLAIILLVGWIDPVSLSAGIQQGGSGSETQGWAWSSEHPGLPAESFILDGVELVVRAASFPTDSFTLPASDAADQIASSIAWKPYRELSVTAIPFGRKPGTEALPRAASGGQRSYEAALRSYRTRQGGKVQDGPSATLFGKSVTAIHSVVPLYIDGAVPTPVIIDEWVVEAGSRLWLVRASREQIGADARSADFASGLTIDSETLGNASTLGTSRGGISVQSPGSRISASSLPTPAWWNGDCDYNTYYAKSGVGSYRLGAVYQGLVACGPRPYADDGPDVLVRFFSGAWGEYEWECVELTMRFLYLMYGISPYQANGSQVVWNYAGSRLVKVANGSVGQAPQPNDVLSYGATSTFGHASVVTASSVDANGNGTITVIEENNSASGSSTLSVSSWWVSGNAGAVSGWLHDASADTGNVRVTINGTPTGTYTVPSPGSIASAYTGVSSGPVQISGLNGASILSSMRVIYGGSSYSEMMGYPDPTATDFYFPWYNNVAMDSQLRISNLGSSPTIITITLGTTQIDGFILAGGAAFRQNYAGQNGGPLHVHSDSPGILATIRVLYGDSSYSEMMGYPDNTATDFYFPWYNNVAMDSQLRISNLGSSPTIITVTLGTTQIDGFILAGGAAFRQNYAGQNSGPLHVHSDSPGILSTIRVLYGGSSLSEMMGYPSNTSTDFYFPAYDNVNVDSQLRISNLGGSSADITVILGSTSIDSFSLAPGTAYRQNYATQNSGPLHAHSDSPGILATVRMLFGGSSFYEMIGYPNATTTAFYFPWYNNVAMDTQLRFGRP